MSRSDKIKKPSNPRNYAVWLLSRREWSEAELRARLSQKGCTPEEIDDVIQFVQSYALQSDARYTASKVREQARRRGNRGVAYVLASKGVDADLVAAELAQTEPEFVRAIQAVSRYEGQPLDLKLRNKLYRFLAGRGFSGSSIKAALKHLDSYGDDLTD